MLLSIITINRNNAKGLRKTIESVLGQTYTNFEYIIIDGASADGSVEVISEFLGKPDQSKQNSTYWLSPFGGVRGGFISEPDTGIYNAMNKGIRMAKGEYIQFLNSGDWLAAPDVISRVAPDLAEADIVVGNVISVRPDDRRRHNADNRELSFLRLYHGTLHHTSAFIARAMFQRYGLYDESLRIVSDWKWYLQAVGLGHARVRFTDVYVSCFDTTGISSTQLHLDKAERRRILV